MKRCQTLKRRATGWSRQRHPALQRVGWVVVAGRRGVARRDQPVDERLVGRGEAIGERADIVLPLSLGARPGDGASDEAVIEHPGERELPGRDALRAGVGGHGLGDVQALLAPLRLHHAPVLPPGARALLGRHAGAVFPGQHAARERAVGEDAEPELPAGRQVLHFGHAVQRVVVGLADHRPVDSGLVAQMAQRGDTPGAMIGDAEMADFPGTDEVGDRMDHRLQRGAVVLPVQIENVDDLGAEPLQAGIDGVEGVASRQAAAIGARLGDIAELRRQHPPGTLGRDRPADDLLRAPIDIGIGGVDEIDALLARAGDDAPRRRFVGGRPECHGAETERRNGQATAPEPTILHDQASPSASEAVTRPPP